MRGTTAECNDALHASATLGSKLRMSVVSTICRAFSEWYENCSNVFVYAAACTVLSVFARALTMVGTTPLLPMNLRTLPSVTQCERDFLPRQSESSSEPRTSGSPQTGDLPPLCRHAWCHQTAPAALDGVRTRCSTPQASAQLYP